MFLKSITFVALICTFGIFGVQSQGFGNFGRRNGGNSERGGAFPSNNGYNGYGNIPSNPQSGSFGGYGNNPQNGNFGGFQNPQNGGFGGFQNPQNGGFAGQFPGQQQQQQQSGGFRHPRFSGRF